MLMDVYKALPDEDCNACMTKSTRPAASDELVGGEGRERVDSGVDSGLNSGVDWDVD